MKQRGKNNWSPIPLGNAGHILQHYTRWWSSRRENPDFKQKDHLYTKKVKVIPVTHLV